MKTKKNVYAGRVSRSILYIAAFLILILFVLLPCTHDFVHAASNFIIHDYYIKMDVNEDDTYDIYEKLEVEFTAPSHGIYRTIPFRTRLDRDGQVSTFYAKITDFKMISGQPFKVNKNYNDVSYKIGDPNKYADTNTTYEYSYKYDTRGDHLKDADEVYHNLVGTSWEAQTIDQVSFKITFPKDIDMANVGMKTGFQENVEFETEGNRVIKGSTVKKCIGGLTIRAVLPEGYFTRQAKTSNTLLYVLIGVLAIAALFGIVLWRKFGVDPPIVEPVEFYPPKGLSAPEVGYLKDGEIKGEHVIAILLTLADKGYVKIKETKTTTKFLKREVSEYEIIKLKEYDGNVIGESTFMNGLFKGSSNTVKVKDLNDSFYKTVEKIKNAVVKRYEDKLYDKKAADCAMLMNVAGSIGIAALMIVSKIANQSPFFMGGETIFNIFLLAVAIILPILSFYMIASRVSTVKKKFTDILLIIFMLPVAAGGIGMAMLFDIVTVPQMVPFLIGLAACLVLFIVAALCERKSDFYTKTLGEIRGYERFLKSAEKERMEALAEEDPDYFYRNLAFAFALGVTSVFAKHFASLAVRPPEWYDTNDPTWTTGSSFNSMSMMNSINSMMTSTSSSMTSSPSSSGSGGGSFSGGGGGGGGGGGSW